MRPTEIRRRATQISQSRQNPRHDQRNNHLNEPKPTEASNACGDSCENQNDRQKDDNADYSVKSMTIGEEIGGI